MYTTKQLHDAFEVPQYPAYAYYDNAFTLSEIEQLKGFFNNTKMHISELLCNDNIDQRNSFNNWLYINEDNYWFGERVNSVASMLNKNYYNMTLDSFQPFQLTEYNPQQFYDWHLDCETRTYKDVIRKLSLIVLLSNKDEYEGGDLELMYSKDVDIIEQKAGRIIVFPSYILHRVTPVTKGVRRSIVTWFSGPLFK